MLSPRPSKVAKAAPAMARRLNRATALKIIRERKQISRAEVAAITGLARNSVSDIFEALRVDGLIRSDGFANASDKGGRRRELWRINPDAGAVVCIDLERSKVEGALMSFDGRILAKRHATPRRAPTRKTVLAAALSVVDKLLADKRAQRVLGVGVATFGRLDPAKEVGDCYGLLPGWDHVPLRETFEQHAGCRTVIETNLVAAALAEQWFGAAHCVDDFAVLLCRTGIGVGLCANGAIIDGASGRAGELGHITVDEAGPTCACGSQGCLEAVASRTALVRQVEQAAKRRTWSPLVTKRSPKSVTLEAVIEAANNGDALGKQLLSDMARHVGVALANVVCLTDPELIVIGPALGSGGQAVVEAIGDEVNRRIPGGASRQLRIELSALGDDLVLLGAGALVLDKVHEGTIV